MLSGLAAMAVAGCATMRPDLEWLNSSVGTGTGQPPVILIHGLLGSRLVDTTTGKELWPGSVLS